MRHKDDFYETPFGLTRQLLKVIGLSSTSNVFEPCAGKNAICKVIRNETGAKIITNDINSAAKADYCFDASEQMFYPKDLQRANFDWVITNPPFNIAHKILPLMWKYSNIGMAMLLRLSYLEPCSNRALWLQENEKNLAHLLVFNPRPKFKKGNGTDSSTVAWFVWKKENTNCKIHFINKWN